MKNKSIKYYYLALHLISIITVGILHAEPGDSCEDAVDYGLINSNTIISGSFDSEDSVEEYWIKFSTTCNFRDITLSTCGSLSDGIDDFNYIDTFNSW